MESQHPVQTTIRPHSQCFFFLFSTFLHSLFSRPRSHFAMSHYTCSKTNFLTVVIFYRFLRMTFRDHGKKTKTSSSSQCENLYFFGRCISRRSAVGTKITFSLLDPSSITFMAACHLNIRNHFLVLRYVQSTRSTFTAAIMVVNSEQNSTMKSFHLFAHPTNLQSNKIDINAIIAI